MKRHSTIDALLGVAVGDAIGVPVEFRSRGLPARDPVMGVRGYGSHHQPPGTWSDDSSLTFCLAEMLCTGYDLDDLAHRFINWKQHAYWTAHGNVFDIGNGTAIAIDNGGLAVGRRRGDPTGDRPLFFAHLIGEDCLLS